VQDDSLFGSIEDLFAIAITPYSTPPPEASNDFIPPPPHSPSSPPPPQRLRRVTTVDSVSSSLEVTLVAPASPVFPSIPQQQLAVTSVDLVSSPSEITSAPVSPVLSSSKEQVPTTLQDLSQVHEALSTEALSTFTPHRSHSPPSLLPFPHGPVHFDFALTLVTAAVLFSAPLIVLKTIPTRLRKVWSKIEDIGNHRNGATTPGNASNFVQLFQLVQYTARPARLVFDPGGLVLVPLSHEDARERKPSTYSTARPLSSLPAALIPHYRFRLRFSYFWC
jgi:hypothetical protein